MILKKTFFDSFYLVGFSGYELNPGESVKSLVLKHFYEESSDNC